MIYLASPYTHPDTEIVAQRYNETMRVNASLLAAGRFVYSPIVHCHAMANAHTLPTEYEFWKNFNYHMIECSNAVYFLLLPEWQNSKGMFGELTYADMAGKGIYTVLLDAANGYTVSLARPTELKKHFTKLATRI